MRVRVLPYKGLINGDVRPKGYGFYAFFVLNGVFIPPFLSFARMMLIYGYFEKRCRKKVNKCTR